MRRRPNWAQRRVQMRCLGLWYVLFFYFTRFFKTIYMFLGYINVVKVHEGLRCATTANMGPMTRQDASFGP